MVDFLINSALFSYRFPLMEAVFRKRIVGSFRTLKELSRFASGLEKDLPAVENAVASPLSNGFVEGTNSKLKMIKRTMYGRCSKELLAAKRIYASHS